MSLADLLLAGAGLLGTVTAVLHGFIMQKRIVAPLAEMIAADGRLRGASAKLVAPLLHVSTTAWLASGIVLLVLAVRPDIPGRPTVSMLAGAIYFYAAVLNGAATRWRHPGWLLMALACLLLALAGWRS